MLEGSELTTAKHNVTTKGRNAMAVKKDEASMNDSLSDKNLQIMLHTASMLVAGKSRDLSMRQLAVLLHCSLTNVNQTVRGLAALLTNPSVK